MDDNRLYRAQREQNLSYVSEWFLKPGEWDHDHAGLTKESEKPWIKRYNYERDILIPIIEDNNIEKIIELGSGPGKLSSLIMEKKPELNYHLVDKVGAQNGFDFRNYKGTFHVKDLNLKFDTSDIDNDFDLLIANDFLEHIQAPSRVILDSRKVIKEGGLAFISVPNWRTNHDFIYRGLFDFDNFIFLMKTHGFDLLGYSTSPLKTIKTQKIDSERTLPEDAIDSWNWYLLFKKVDE